MEEETASDSSGDLSTHESIPRLGQMFARFLKPAPQSRSGRTVEVFGWYDLTLGLLILFAPAFMATALHLPELNPQAMGYVRLVGLLVSGLGALYIVSGRLDARGFIFASLLDRPAVPLVMAVLWYLNILPGPLALAFSISDFGGFLWTLSAWRQETRAQSISESPAAGIAAGFFGFVSGVIRNARTFHPDGRVFRGSVHSLQPANESLRNAAAQLDGTETLMRFGMGVMKRGMPPWLVRLVPDAPSIATRFFSQEYPGEIRIRRGSEDLDLLCTAGGDRLWKLLFNLAAGGFWFGLKPHDYFRNLYYADVPFRVDNGKLHVWIRLAPAEDAIRLGGNPEDGEGREQGLTNAAAAHAAIRIEAQCLSGSSQAFVPIAEIRFEEELQVDQETLHFDPVAARGFVPFGFLSEVRRSVYPASVASRPAYAAERRRRERDTLFTRVARYFGQKPAAALQDESVGMKEESAGMNASTQHSAIVKRQHWLRLAGFALLALVSVTLIYFAIRLTRDKPVDYVSDVDHFLHGSTGGERTMGIPYWFWVALPELFPEYLPDRQPGRGYQSFGMIYEAGKDPRYALPAGVSMRNVRGIDVVYLNCAICHTGSVRDAPGAAPRVVAGMPANTLNLGAFEKFLTSIPLDQKFIPQRMLDQIDSMANSPNRVIDKPDALNRLIFRYYAVYLMREKMLMLRQRLSFIAADTWGPGRVDTFNAPKALLNFNMTNADPREMMGNADFPSIWNQGPRQGMQLHWDGNNTSVNERNLSAAFGTGAYPPTLDADRVLRTANWLLTAKPPSYPYPIDSSLAQQGAPLYQEYCAGCHGTRDAPFRSARPRADERVGTVVPIGEIGTDRWRLDSYTYLVAANQSTLYAGYEKDWGFDPPYPQRFSHFHKTQGYANMPLDGIWLRGPFLHNGSVPNLRELLEPAAARSQTFYRGDDVYDRDNVGFVSTVAERNNQKLFFFQTSDKGNGNQGHEGKRYGTELTAPEKHALLEYLKTF